MKKLIHSFERDGRRFEIIDDNGQLYCCLVEKEGDSLNHPKFICYAEYEGVDLYETPGVRWSFEITKTEVHLEDALYQRFLASTDFLRYMGAL